MEIAVGGWTGTGVDDRTITTTLTGKPSLVYVMPGAEDPVCFATTDMPVGQSKRAADALAVNIIQLLNNDGSFQVGTLLNRNDVAVDYWHISIRDNNAGDCGVVSYVGDSLGGRLIDVGAQPNFVIVIGGHAVAPVFRTDFHADNQCSTFGGAAPAEAIQRFDPDGFIIGNDARVNTNLQTYYAFWSKNVPNLSNTVTYVGDGTDNRNIANGFLPDWATVTDLSVQKPVTGRNSAMPDDYSARHDGGGNFSNGIQRFVSNSFQLGTLHFVNAGGDTCVGYTFAVGASEAVGGSLRRVRLGVGL